MFFHDALPFIFGLLYIVLAPGLDRLSWRNSYIAFYRHNDQGPITPEQLTDGAAWAVDLAQVIPGALLTLSGVLLLWDEVSGIVAGVAVVLTLVPLVLVGAIQGRENLHNPKADLRLWEYSLPQLFLAGLDVAAIIVIALR